MDVVRELAEFRDGVVEPAENFQRAAELKSRRRAFRPHRERAAIAVDGLLPLPELHWTVTGKVDGEFGGGTTTYAITGRLSKAW